MRCDYLSAVHCVWRSKGDVNGAIGERLSVLPSRRRTVTPADRSRLRRRTRLEFEVRRQGPSSWATSNLSSCAGSPVVLAGAGR